MAPGPWDEANNIEEGGRRKRALPAHLRQFRYLDRPSLFQRMEWEEGLSASASFRYFAGQPTDDDDDDDERESVHLGKEEKIVGKGVVVIDGRGVQE